MVSLTPTQLILTFFLAGLSLKIADYLGEKGLKLKAYLASTISAFLFWILIKNDPQSSTIICSIIIGCLLSLKVDKPNLLLGLILILALSIFLGFSTPVFWLLLILTLVVILDEFTHEKFAQKRGFSIFFRFRMFLKIAVIILFLVNFLSLTHLLGFLLFDLSYDLLGLYLEE